MLISASSVSNKEDVVLTKSINNVLSSMMTYIVKREEKGFKNVFLTYYLTKEECEHVTNILHEAGYQFKKTEGKVCNDGKKSVQFHIDWSKANVETRSTDSKL